ncbi:MAG: hypothetical protein J6I79_09655 [Paludibacteraceae bacterium]|nr:hypothetical protein [Paludibacteraceae bacterium]
MIVSRTHAGFNCSKRLDFDYYSFSRIFWTGERLRKLGLYTYGTNVNINSTMHRIDSLTIEIKKNVMNLEKYKGDVVDFIDINSINEQMYNLDNY